MDYNKFLSKKIIAFEPSGFSVDVEEINCNAFDWQKILVKWALIKGKSALFEDTGLGKTIQQLAWADCVCRHTGGNVIIFAPLAVSHQTIREGNKFGISVNRCDSQKDVIGGINITNYERIDKFDPNNFIGVVLDESSRIKSDTAKFRQNIIDLYVNTPYKLCCSATPSPNDYTELGNTAEFLGVMSLSEMKSMFFVNDSGDTTSAWRLKGHVVDNKFWEWLSSWCVMIRRPSDIGFSDDGYILPELKFYEHVIPYESNGWFTEPATGLSGMRSSMKETLVERCRLVSDIVNKSDDIWAVWCNLNPEGELLSKLINNSVEVSGKTDDDSKVKSFIDFSENKIKCLVTKPKIAMFGMNWQNCNHIAITGISHSFEQFYQLVRRFWRFGQDKPVYCHIIIGEREGNVIETIKRKEKQMIDMFGGMAKHMKKLTLTEISGTNKNKSEYKPNIEMILPDFL